MIFLFSGVVAFKKRIFPEAAGTSVRQDFSRNRMRPTAVPNVAVKAKRYTIRSGLYRQLVSWQKKLTIAAGFTEIPGVFLDWIASDEEKTPKSSWLKVAMMTQSQTLLDGEACDTRFIKWPKRAWITWVLFLQIQIWRGASFVAWWQPFQQYSMPFSKRDEAVPKSGTFSGEIRQLWRSKDCADSGDRAIARDSLTSVVTGRLGFSWRERTVYVGAGYLGEQLIGIPTCSNSSKMVGVI